MSLNHLDPDNRLEFAGDFDQFLAAAVEFYSLGTIKTAVYLAEGYEDTNIRLSTTSGDFVLKSFANNQLGDNSKHRRGPEVADRLVKIIQAIGANSDSSISRLVGKSGDPDADALFRYEELVSIAYPWVEGNTYYDLATVPSKSELDEIIEQVAIINTTPHQPVWYHDIWAVSNIANFVGVMREYLSDEDIQLIQRVMSSFDQVDLESLPKCLVHGDLTKGNVIKTASKPVLIDYSVTNWTTRVIETALIASNLLHDEKARTSLQDRIDQTIELYESRIKLSDSEKQALYPICLAVAAMELIGARWLQVFREDKSEETQFWLELGRQSLRAELNTRP